MDSQANQRWHDRIRIDSEWSKVALACRRMALVHRSTNLWTPMQKWARICSLCEYRWQKIIVGFKGQSEELWQLVAPLHVSSVARQNQLEEILTTFRIQAAKIDSWFRPIGGGSESSFSDSSISKHQLPVKNKKVGAP